jgi:spore germination protein GerM
MRRLGVLLVLALIVGVAACGLSENGEPRVIAASDLPAELADPNPSSSTTAAPSLTTSQIAVYYLVQQDGVPRLIAVAREVEDPSRPRDRLAAMLLPPTAEEQAAGILTSIPSDTVLLNTQLIEDELVVDLSQSLFDVQGEELRNAFAQMVWTATELDGVVRVRFLVDGEELRAPDAAGVEQPGAVRRSDYQALAPA